MSEIKFGNDAGSSPAPVIEEQTEVVNTPVEGVKVATTTTVANTNTSVVTTGGGFVLGDDLPGFKDVMLPRLNLVYAVGELGKTFPVGAIVFKKDTLLYSPAIIDAAAGTITKAALPPIVLYVIGVVSKRFSEKIEGGMGGDTVDTEEQVRAAGGTINYKEWELKRDEGMRRFEPLWQLLVAIEKPAHIADDGTVFGFDIGQRKMAVGFWDCKGSCYTQAVKGVFNLHRVTGVLRGGYFTHSFKISTKVSSFSTKKGKFSAPVPVCTPFEKTSPEVLEFIRSIVQA